MAKSKDKTKAIEEGVYGLTNLKKQPEINSEVSLNRSQLDWAVYGCCLGVLHMTSE